MEDDRIGLSKPRDLIAVWPTKTRSTTWRSSVSALVKVLWAKIDGLAAPAKQPS